MPVWHEATKGWVKDGKVTVLGVTQEQHPDRCRLFCQWKGIGWPVLHDPINILGLTAVPVFVAVDEHGVVRAVRPAAKTFGRDFVDRKFPAPEGGPQMALPSLTPVLDKDGRPGLDRLAREARQVDTRAAWRALGDALALWGGPKRHAEAIAAYQAAVGRGAKDGAARFRLGVAHRLRLDSAGRKRGDFQAAVDAWSAALDLDPNQYIWNRRIQQYGARLSKPYAFYDWVEPAQKAICARKERPVELLAPVVGAEVARPQKAFTPTKEAEKAPDPTGQVLRDRGLARAEVTVVPGSVRAGGAARVHVSLRPTDKARWNNEAGPLRLWVEGAEGWSASARLLSTPQPREAESGEERRLDFEVQAPAATKPGPVTLKAYAVFHACEKESGQCLYRRLDLTFTVTVKK